MQNYRYILFLISAFIQTALFAQQSHNIELHYIDQKPDFNPTIKDVALNDNGLKSFEHKLQQQFFNKGYLSFSIDSTNSNKNGINYFVFTGKKHKIEAIQTQNKHLPFLKKFVVKPILTPKNEHYFDAIIHKHIKNKGYPYATLSKKLIETSTGYILNYQVILNHQVIFDSIKTSPENIIHYNFLAQATGIKAGQPYSENKVLKIKHHLTQKQLFKIDTAYCHIIGAKSINIIKIKPVKQNSFAALVGLQPQKEGKNKITGRVDFKLKNAFKYGESIIVEWQKTGNFSQSLHSGFTIPYLLNSPIGANVEANIDKKDTTYSNTKLNIDALVSNSLMGTVSIRGKWLTSSVSDENKSNLNNTKSTLYGLGYTYINFNDPVFPTKGFHLKTNIYLGTQQTISKSDNDINLPILEFEGGLINAFKLPFGAMYLKSNWSILESDSLTLNNLYRIGGTNSIRGFNEKSIYAKSFVYNNAEYRVKIGINSYAYIFNDFGFLNITNHDIFTSRTIHAVGTGINIKTQAGYLTVSYALGRTIHDPFVLNEGKIHIGYQNRF